MVDIALLKQAAGFGAFIYYEHPSFYYDVIKRGEFDQPEKCVTVGPFKNEDEAALSAIAIGERDAHERKAEKAGCAFHIQNPKVLSEEEHEATRAANAKLRGLSRMMLAVGMR